MGTHDHALLQKIKTLNETLWEDRAREPDIAEWLDNFAGDTTSTDSERLNALYLLSNFMYFGSIQMRELLKALYRDHIKYPIIHKIRQLNGDTSNSTFINGEYERDLRRIRFLGVGNPSESGSHLLYYFRQENGLPKTLFINTHQVFDRRSAALRLRSPEVTRYIFIDDLCGSGKQGVEYSQDIVEDIKQVDPDLSVGYYVLFGTRDGLKHIRDNAQFDAVEAIFELDSSFKCFSSTSRFFVKAPDGVDKAVAERLARHYGTKLWPRHPLGYDNSQLLIGFHHNTPDNTLPIVWGSDSVPSWTPVFRRYPKAYGW